MISKANKQIHNFLKGVKHAGKYLFKKKEILFAVFLIVVVAGELVYINYGSRKNSTELSAYAQKVIKKCSDASYKPTCYDEEIPKLMDELSMEETFKVTWLIQNDEKEYQYCHVLGHKLSARETAKDPNNWQGVIQRCPSGVCSNGCIHGAFQERFRKESLTAAELGKYKTQFAEVCEKKEGFSPTGIEQASCYHALGHLFMYVTDAEIDKSLDLCRELAKKNGRDYRQLCYDGAFMQIFQPLEPDDFSLIEGKEVGRSEVKEFCDNYTGEEQGSCWSESWPLFREDLQRDPKKLINHCSYLPVRERSRCFSALMYVLTAQMGFDKDRISTYCNAMTGSDKGNCYAQASSRIIETDYRNSKKSVDLCLAAGEEGSVTCFNELLKYSTYNFHAGSQDFYAFCNAMPDPWNGKCLSKERGTISNKAIAE